MQQNNFIQQRMKQITTLLLLATALVNQSCATKRSSLIQAQGCPPGFSGTPCKCDASDYKGMRCYRDRAYIIHGYWVGKCENGTLCTGKCPLGYCVHNDSQLPDSISELDEYMCGPTRTGVLCGECRDNYSASYHSSKCIPDNSCNYGPLLYVASELVPLTVMFIVVIVFNISFTSGAVNGFIFFAQVQDSLGSHPEETFSRKWYIWGYSFVYEFFNFNFFNVDFCLWKGAIDLDAVALKYVTIMHAFLLVFICVYVMNSSRVKQCFPCLRRSTRKSILIHGLTAFFVLCYSQCARVSFAILQSTSLYGVHSHFLKTVVFSNGQLSMFGPTHLKYAIPALLFGSSIVILPPIVLILYPLMFKILARCNLSESKPVNCLSRLVPMQLLDSFQSCFKDSVRFFAGLYFVYRLVLQAIWSISLGIDNFKIIYSALTVTFILILALHAAVQPYKQRIHNVVDVVIFSDLATICSLSLSDYCESTLREYHIVLSTQIVLFYMPLVCLLSIGFFRFSKAILRYCKTKCRSRQETTPLLTDSCDLPPLREE